MTEIERIKEITSAPQGTIALIVVRWDGQTENELLIQRVPCFGLMQYFDEEDKLEYQYSTEPLVQGEFGGFATIEYNYHGVKEWHLICTEHDLNDYLRGDSSKGIVSKFVCKEIHHFLTENKIDVEKLKGEL